MLTKIEDKKCPNCSRMSLFLTKLRTRINYPFGVKDKSSRVTVKEKVIKCIKCGFIDIVRG